MHYFIASRPVRWTMGIFAKYAEKADISTYVKLLRLFSFWRATGFQMQVWETSCVRNANEDTWKGRRGYALKQSHSLLPYTLLLYDRNIDFDFLSFFITSLQIPWPKKSANLCERGEIWREEMFSSNIFLSSLKFSSPVSLPFFLFFHPLLIQKRNMKVIILTKWSSNT